MNTYLKELRKYILIAGALFCFGGVLGYISAAASPQEALVFQEEVTGSVEPLLQMEAWQLALLIFVNNSVKVLGSMVLGVLISIPPAFFLLLNGNLLGTFGFLVSQNQGWAFFALGLLPHGVLELSAVVIGSAAGLRLGSLALGRILGRDGVSLREEFRKAFRLYLRLLVPLFLLAALLEAYLTPLLLSAFF